MYRVIERVITLEPVERLLRAGMVARVLNLALERQKQADVCKF